MDIVKDIMLFMFVFGLLPAMFRAEHMTLCSMITLVGLWLTYGVLGIKLVPSVYKPHYLLAVIWPWLQGYNFFH